ncbi:MAG: hypothetical protein AAF919_13730 [Pseudomonadota bacterium]
MIEQAEFNVIGFKELGTAAQDYGNGVVRLHHALPEHYAPARTIRRNDLVRIETDSHARLYAVARFVQADDIFLIGLEYDARAQLSAKKGTSVALTVRKARAVEYVGYLWNHPTILVRIEFRLAIALTLAGFLLGLAASGMGL